jgi:hypothetical protein
MNKKEGCVMVQTIEELAEAALLEMDEATRQWAGEIADLLASVAGPADPADLGMAAGGEAGAEGGAPPADGPVGPCWSDEGRVNAEVIYRWIHGETVQGPDLAAELRYWLDFLGCELPTTDPEDIQCESCAEWKRWGKGQAETALSLADELRDARAGLPDVPAGHDLVVLPRCWADSMAELTGSLADAARDAITRRHLAVPGTERVPAMDALRRDALCECCVPPVGFEIECIGIQSGPGAFVVLATPADHGHHVTVASDGTVEVQVERW